MSETFQYYETREVQIIKLQIAVVDKSPYHAARSSNAFSVRVLKKKQVFVNSVVKNKSKCGLSWSVLLSTTSTRHCYFSLTFSSYCFCMLNEFAKVFERKI